MPKVMEANLGGQVSLGEHLPERAHHGIPAADLAPRVRENETRVGPRGSRHSLLKLALLVRLEGRDRARSYPDSALLAGLGGGDARSGARVRGAPHGDRALL